MTTRAIFTSSRGKLGGFLHRNFNAPSYAGAALFFGATLAALALSPLQAASFSIEHERQSIAELRAKDPDLLSDEERAILRAADSYGNVRFCNNRYGGNGLLVRFNGRPAVVTSAHMFIESSTSEIKCSTEDFQGVFFPNVSYYGEPDHARDEEFVLRTVDMEYPPLNMKPYLEALAKKNNVATTSSDWLVFFLDEDITTDIMPGGHERGYLEYTANRSWYDRGQLYLIGMHVDLDDGLIAHYQKCDYANGGNLAILHTCDSLPGTSGSTLLTLEDGELRLYGVHSSARVNDDGSHFLVAPPDDRSQWKVATPGLRIFEAQAAEFQTLP